MSKAGWKVGLESWNYMSQEWFVSRQDFQQMARNWIRKAAFRTQGSDADLYGF